MGKRPAEALEVLDFIQKDLDDVALKYFQGNPYMLFEGIRRCAQYRVPMPDWIRQELEAGLRRYTRGEKREFGDAFGIVRAKGENLAAIRIREKYGWELYTFVEGQVSAGRLLKEALADASAKFPVSSSTAKSIYYHVRGVLQTLQPERFVPKVSKTLRSKKRRLRTG